MDGSALDGAFQNGKADLQTPEGPLMGVALGAWGDVFPRFEIPGECPPEIAVLRKIFGIFAKTFGFSNICKIKLAKSEDKSEFGYRWF